jgi:predicted transcriptional regulator
MSKNENTVKVLTVLEDVTAKGEGAHVRDIATVSGLSETTVRKQLKELETGGFARRVPNATTQWEAVSKHEDDAEPKSNGAQGRGRPRTPEAEARDGAVLALIKKGVGDTGEIAKSIGTTRGLAYLSVWRLVKAGLVKKEATGTRSPNYVPT